MAEAYLDLLRAFNFTEMQTWIAVISTLLFSANLLGGILSALSFVNSNLLQNRPLSERISFRLFILSEVMLWVFVFFYHVFMIEEIIVAHVIYWFSATLMMPLLAVIGSQIIQVTFSGKIKAKEAEYHRRQKAIREKRRKEADEVGNKPAESPLQAAARKAQRAKTGKTA